MDLGSITSLLKESLPDLIAVYVFGSRASQQPHSRSDLDVAFLSRSPLDPVARWQLQEQLAALLGIQVDLVDLRRASTVLRKEVVATGKIIWDGDPVERARFEMYVLSSYARLNEERAGILEDIRRRGTVYG
jgi:predicted nucleotidyltransferase